ncbi:hypothetical protein Q0M94_02120 [Deinococcus radiomollis]|uniref:hypothetical protein n=1 Tax=Deinococcus radiomollis TaxID=468916 RepID=UPI003891324D
MPRNLTDGLPDALLPDAADAFTVDGVITRSLLYLHDPAMGKLRAMTSADLASAVLSGTTVQRQAIPLSSLAQRTVWNETDLLRRSVSFTPGDTIWRTAGGTNPDAPDSGVY